MQYEAITFDVKDHVAYITLNRPDAANGLNMAMGKDLMHAAIRCDEDPEIRAVLLTGAGKMFSAGGDLTFLSASEWCLEYYMEKWSEVSFHKTLERS